MDEKWIYLQDIATQEKDLSLILNNNAVELPDGRYLLSGRYYPRILEKDDGIYVSCTVGWMEQRSAGLISLHKKQEGADGERAWF